MLVTAVYDMVYSVEIEMPDGTTEDEAMKIAGEYLDENICEIADGFSWAEIDVKEVWI